MKGGAFGALSLIAVLTAVPALATDPAPAAFKTVASQAYVDITRQSTISATSDGTNNTPNYVYNQSTNPNAAGSVVTTTTTAGTVGERGIANAPVSNGSGGYTNGDWLPTVNAMMGAINAHTPTALTWTATETTAAGNYSTAFDGQTGNWPAADAGKLIDATGLATALSNKQNKITTGLAQFDDVGTTATVPALVVTNAAGTALNGNTIGFLDLNTYYNLESGYDEFSVSDADKLVPSLGLINIMMSDIWDSMPSPWTPLSWVVNDDDGANRTAAINAYNTTFGSGTNNWVGTGSGNHLINGQFLANSLALKQNKITTELVDGVINQQQVQLSSLVSYDSTNGLTGNQIGILTQDEFVTNFGDWYDFALDDNSTDSPGMDSVVPTVRAVANAIKTLKTLNWSGTQSTAINAYNSTFGSGTNNWAGTSTYLINGQFLANSLALKQNKLEAKASNARAQAVTRSTAGNTLSAYITAGGSVGLTTRSGAPAVINYVNGTVATTEDMETFTTGTFGSNSTVRQNNIKNALVSLELLKDVYSELNAKITNNALPTGTTGTVVTYNGTNANTGVQEFTETAIYNTANAYNASTDAGKLATAGFVATKQNQIGATTSTYVYDSTNNTTADGSVVTTNTLGVTGERGIATAPVYTTNNNVTTLTNSSWLPTMGAMMNQINTATATLTWTSTETTAASNYSTSFAGTTGNWPAADADKKVDGTALAAALATKQNKMVCTGWSSDTHTDANCWIWSIE